MRFICWCMGKVQQSTFFLKVNILFSFFQSKQAKRWKVPFTKKGIYFFPMKTWGSHRHSTVFKSKHVAYRKRCMILLFFQSTKCTAFNWKSVIHRIDVLILNFNGNTLFTVCHVYIFLSLLFPSLSFKTTASSLLLILEASCPSVAV